MNFEPIIGLEIHVQPKTKSKMFCRCSAAIFGDKPNTHVCPVCLGLPGALPVLNQEAIEKTVLLGLALDCKISSFSKFDRKNYFYPDLPKGYQISQYDKPVAIEGSLKLKIKNEKLKIVRIRRVHMEEDTGKIIHKKDCSLIDFNRSGMPLIEIVTEPDLRSAEEVSCFLKELQLLIKHFGISEAEMSRGTMRLEPNISVRKIQISKSPPAPRLRRAGKIPNEAYPDYKVEVKNINSFKFVEKAVRYEIGRQIELIESGKKIKQETRGWDERKRVTVGQRVKEEAQDYRYFPEPDLPPLKIDSNWQKRIKESMPESPTQKEKRYLDKFNLPEKYVKILVGNNVLSAYFEKAVATGLSPKEIVDLIINKPVIMRIPPIKLKSYLEDMKKNVVSDDNFISGIVDEVIGDNPKPAEDFKKGKGAAMKFLIGQAMKKSLGRLDPKVVEFLLRKKLEK